MGRFTLEQRKEILKTYFQCEGCVAQTVRVLKRSFGRNEAPTAPAVRKFVQKVRETGMLVDKTHGPRRRTVRTDKNVAAVAESVRLNSRTSIRHRSQQLNISRTSLRRILHKDLNQIPEDEVEAKPEATKKTTHSKTTAQLKSLNSEPDVNQATKKTTRGRKGILLMNTSPNQVRRRIQHARVKPLSKAPVRMRANQRNVEIIAEAEQEDTPKPIKSAKTDSA